MSILATRYFPSLEELKLQGLWNLRGWSRAGEIQPRLLPRLSKLSIEHCPMLQWIPLVPMVPSFKGITIHGKLVNQLLNGEEALAIAAPSTISQLKKLEVGFVDQLHCLSINLSLLESLTVWRCNELVQVIAKSAASSLRHLTIDGCPKLKDISGALKHFSVLEKLEICYCEELDFGYMTSAMNVDTSPWQSLKRLRHLSVMKINKVESLFRGVSCLTTLECLELYQLDNLKVLPESIRHLTQLRKLVIWDCPNISSLPDFFSSLSKLQFLQIRGCDDLMSRCKKHSGEYWHLIQHIPSVKMCNRWGGQECNYSHS